MRRTRSGKAPTFSRSARSVRGASQAALAQTLSVGRRIGDSRRQEVDVFNRRGRTFPTICSRIFSGASTSAGCNARSSNILKADEHELRNLAQSDPGVAGERGALLPDSQREPPGVRIFLSGVPLGVRVRYDFVRPLTRWNSYFLDQDRVELLGDRLHFDLEGTRRRESSWRRFFQMRP